MGTLDDALRKATLGLELGTQRDRVVGCYLWRRGRKLAGEHPGWDADTLADLLILERAVVGTYAREKERELARADPKSPKHLDLAVMARISSRTNWTGGALRLLLEPQYRRSRGDWIWQIVWRAVMVHDDLLWQAPPPQRRLHTAALDELVDRRLRVVERMACNVNTGGVRTSTGQRRWQVAGPDGPWLDGMLVRIFEYPFLPRKDFEAHLPRMAGWRTAGNMIIYDPARGISPIQVPARAQQSWQSIRTPGGMTWMRFRVNSTPTPAAAIEELFELGHEDFLDRSWLYCDQVGAALSIEALWFGRTRRDGNPAAFDTVLRRPDYVGFGVVLGRDGPVDIGVLMADGASDQFFENTAVEVEDLQVGDFVCFWNNRVYDLVANGAWRNEFSYVMGVDADPVTGQIRNTQSGPQLWVAGHGLHTALYNTMAAELVNELRGPMERLREAVTREVALNPAATRLFDDEVVKWAPYQDFDPPGPWWLLIPQATWLDWGYPTLDAAVRGAPRTVARDPAPGTGYREPPDPTALYFPLWQPRVAQATGDDDSWRAYLRRRKADPAYRAPNRLDPLSVDAGLAPGLFLRGAGTTVPVVRPRVRV